MVMFNMCQINNSTGVGNEKKKKKQAIQWIAPNQTPTKALSYQQHPVHCWWYQPKTLLPCSLNSVWNPHPDHWQYTWLLFPSVYQLPSKLISAPLNWLSDLVPHHSWLRFLEHLSRLIDVKGLVPSEDVYYKIHGCICKYHNFKMGGWKVFNAPCNALQHEPQCLE